MNILPDNWNSQRLTTSNLKEEEISLAQDIFETSRYVMKQWDGEEYDPDHIRNCFFEGNLPPGGKVDNYRIQSIRYNEDKKMIGLLSVYHGYSTTESVYLEFLYIERNIQKQGLGQELIKQLITRITALGYKEIRINVTVKNWSALRYWIKSGFNNVSGIYGDNEYSESTFANLELIKIL